MQQQNYKIVFATKDNKDNLDQDADIIIITPDDHNTYYKNLPVCAKYIFACNTQEKFVKIPFGCSFGMIHKRHYTSGEQFLQFELLDKVKIILDDEPVKDNVPTYEEVNGNHIYTINQANWFKLAKHYKAKKHYSTVIYIDSDDE